MLELEEASLDPCYSPYSTAPSSSLLHQAPPSPRVPGGWFYHPGPIRAGSEVADLLSGLISSCVTWQGPCHHTEGYTEQREGRGGVTNIMKEGGCWAVAAFFLPVENRECSWILFPLTYLILFLADGRQHRVDIKEVISFHTGDNVNTLHVCRLPASFSPSGKKKKTQSGWQPVALS